MKSLKFTRNYFILLFSVFFLGCSSDDNGNLPNDDDNGNQTQDESFGEYQIEFLDGDLEGTIYSGDFTSQDGAGIYFENPEMGTENQSMVTLSFEKNNFVFSGQFLLENNNQDVISFGDGETEPASMVLMSVMAGSDTENFISTGGGVNITDLQVGTATSGVAPAGFIISFLGVFHSSAGNSLHDISGVVRVNQN